jgi:hypothetical protein
VRDREHSRRFGVGRFFGHCSDEECGNCRRAGLLARFKGWICWRPCREKSKCQPEPYQTPIRYYFQGDTEMTCSGGTCGTSGECAGAGLSSGIGSRVRGERLAEGRLRGEGDGAIGGRGLAGGGCRGGHCRDREQCMLTGQPFQNELRFARDEKPAAPPIDASKPYDYEGSWHRDGYGAKPAEPPPVQQAGYKTTQR